MKIYSDTITEADLRISLPMGVRIATMERIEKPRTRNEATGEKYSQGWNIYLEGSSMHRSQHNRDEHAATWDEWGIFIANIFHRDPDSKAGFYKSPEHFIEETTRVHERYKGQTSRIAREHRAPWLPGNPDSVPYLLDRIAEVV